MNFVTLLVALVAVVPAAFALTVNTPTNVVECEPTQLTWNGGQSPYYLSLIPAGQPTATPFEQFSTQNGTSVTWTVDLASGTSFTIALKDSTGATAYSDIVTVVAGTSTSCVNTSVPAGGSSSPSTTPASGGSSSASAGSAASTSAASGSATASGSSSTASSTASPASSNGAGRASFPWTLGVAAVMGLVGAALF